jgi:hypothetical protein
MLGKVRARVSVSRPCRLALGEDMGVGVETPLTGPLAVSCVGGG